jgi:hypothetical protein
MDNVKLLVAGINNDSLPYRSETYRKRQIDFIITVSYRLG